MDLAGHSTCQNEEVEMVIYEQLSMERPDSCHDRIIKLLPRWDKCYIAPRDDIKKLYFHGISVLHVTL
jgi:hypothetical protein